MDFKNGARVGLFAFLSVITFQTQANCYNGKKFVFYRNHRVYTVTLIWASDKQLIPIYPLRDMKIN